MPFYRLTITDIYGKVRQGIKEDQLTDIDAYYQKARRKAILTLKNTFKDIDVVMLPSCHPEVKAYLHKKTWGNQSNMHMP